jgi:PIN domain nuclease of toxin-antitoxin system
MILVDTHALLWWALDPDQLSAKARDVLTEMERHGGFASSISIWEIGIKAKRGKLELPIAVDEFAHRIARSGVIEFVPVDTDVWLRSLALPWAHSDPADRVIVASALLRGVPLLTKDALIRKFRGVKCVW